MEKIGNIIIEKDFYPGEDLYSDGKIEDELLELVQKHPESEFRKIIEEEGRWPIFYHLSDIRKNIVDWLPISGNDRVLEVGSGCGAITGALASKAKEVTCIDLSLKRSRINAHRNKKYDNVTIHVGNFKDIEKTLDCEYDYIMLIGVFEYGFGYMGTKNPYEDFMKILAKHLKKNGHIVIAIENKFGMKYYAGCREDHSGRFFDGIEDYPNGDGSARTFSRKRLEEIITSAGIEEYKFFYPYPDYKFPHTIYSDEYLPKIGELYQNIRNFDRDRLLLFDEQRAFDAVIKEGMFPHYSNSYMVVTGPEIESRFAKFSNDRDEKYAVSTVIKEKKGKKWVEKKAVTEAANAHVEGILQSWQELQNRYWGTGLEFNAGKISEPYIESEMKKPESCIILEFLEGQTLEERLDECLAANNKNEFLRLFERFCTLACHGQDYTVTDYDFIFQNIIVNGEHWSVIDYEWTFDKKKSGASLIARAIHCYCHSRAGRAEARAWMEEYCRANQPQVAELLATVAESEAEFQKFVQGDHLALSELRHKIGNPAFSMDYIAERIGAGTPRVQIYEDHGDGFSEDKSYFIDDVCRTDNKLHFSVKLKRDLINVRIDPADYPCYVSIESVTYGGEDISAKVFAAGKGGLRMHNGARVTKGSFFFATGDPHFIWKLRGLLPEMTGELKVCLKVERLSNEVAAAACDALGLKGKL